MCQVARTAVGCCRRGGQRVTERLVATDHLRRYIGVQREWLTFFAPPNGDDVMKAIHEVAGPFRNRRIIRFLQHSPNVIARFQRKVYQLP